jgi:hypothetical protein
VVAEGIEHEDQCAQLLALDCHAGQGNLFAAPLDVESATELLKTGLAPRPERPHEAPSHPRPATSVRQLFANGRRLVNAHVPSFAVPVLALLALVGLMGVVNSVRSAFSGPMMPATEVQQHSIQMTPAAPATPTTASPVSPDTKKTTSGVRDSALVLPLPARAPSPARAAASVSSAAAGAQTASFEVVHLHRFGDCRGRLDVGRDGIAFVSEKQKDADSFTLRFGEFLHSLSDDTLTLKSATKTYRFKAFGSSGDGAGKLPELVERISRARR